MIQVLKPYSFHQPKNTGPHPQNVLVRQYKFPNEYTEKDYLFQIYTEGQSQEEFMEFWLLSELKPQRYELSEKQLKKFLPDLEIATLDQQLKNLSEEQFFSLGNFMAAELGYDQHCRGVLLTGFRVVLYTDRATITPYYRFDFYYTTEPEKRELYSGYNEKNTTIWHLNMLW
jgi:hypothetical protein